MISNELDVETLRLREDLELVANLLSHDLRKSPRIILSACRELKQSCYSQLSCDHQELLDDVLAAAQDMQIMNDAMMEYLHLGLYPIEASLVDCSTVMMEVLHKLDPLIQKTGAQISCSPLPFVYANAKHIFGLFSYLVENAIKFHDLSTSPEICLSSKNIGGMWEFTLEDNNDPVAEEYQEVIFLLFQRLYTAEEIPGYGIGLAICRKIVESSGGMIFVKSNLKKGNRFIFTLPDQQS